MRIGKIAGAQVTLDWSLFMIIGIIFTLNLISFGLTEKTLLATLALAAIYFCVFLHELGHVFMAKRYNIESKSIDINIIAGITTYVKNSDIPQERIAISLAGPAVNMVLAIFFLILTYAIPHELNSYVKLFASVNIMLALFNLLPVMQFDGGKAMFELLQIRYPTKKATQIASLISMICCILLLWIGYVTKNIFMGYIAGFSLIASIYQYPRSR